jgi:hypothetical protein
MSDYSFNVITRQLDLTTGTSSIPSYATAPATGSTGDLYLNTADGIIYIYWGGWQSTGITLTPPAGSLIDIEGSTDDLLLEDGFQIELEA